MEKSQLSFPAEQVSGLITRYLPSHGLDLVVDLQRSQGSDLVDAHSGQTYLDCFSFFATHPLGFNHPHMTSPEVVQELGQAALHKPSNSDSFTREMAGFLKTFVRVAKPDFMEHIFFIEGGTLAVENALKAAFDWKARKNLARGATSDKDLKVIHFRQAFHGRSGYTLSLTNTFDPRKTDFFPKFGWPRIVNPTCRFPLKGDNLAQVEELENEALSQIDKVIGQGSDEVACIILEPIQAEGGDNHFRPQFHQQLRRLCDDHEILLIYDEVQTGLGTTGKMWAFEHYAEPDLLAFGKKFQVCGMMAGKRIDEVPDNVFRVPNRIDSTWSGGLVDMIRCKHYLKVLEKENLLEHSRLMGEVLLEELQGLEQEFTCVSNSRGLGLFCAFDLPDSDFRNRLRQKLFEHHLIILPCGERSIRFRTALNITREALLKSTRIIREALHEM
ncbi:MAG: L-lysine 6-transaminase [Acidobacteriota bacterium]